MKDLTLAHEERRIVSKILGEEWRKEDLVFSLLLFYFILFPGYPGKGASLKTAAGWKPKIPM